VNLEERILRRMRRGEGRRLVVDENALSPVWHPEGPVGRGPTVERVLDGLDPIFEGRGPDDVHVHGPAGTGKSALVTALVDHLARHLSEPKDTIGTTTRAGSGTRLAFAYVDARAATSEFEFYHRLLDEFVKESIPRRGISTEELRDRVENYLRSGRSVVVAFDHVDDAEVDHLGDLLRSDDLIGRRTSWLTIGRNHPDDTHEELEDVAAVSVPKYHRAELTDVLTNRISAGLARDAMTHDQIRDLAEWADGDAHAALAALLGAVDAALADEASVIEPSHLAAGKASVPDPCVSLGRVLALPENRQTVLRRLLELTEDQRSSVSNAAAEIAAASSLSESTIRRYLYEFAESGVVERERAADAGGVGRPPSRVEPRFPTRAFVRLASVES
jgi:Cdc6-like AAA superfamily ATPase